MALVLGVGAKPVYCQNYDYADYNANISSNYYDLSDDNYDDYSDAEWDIPGDDSYDDQEYEGRGSALASNQPNGETSKTALPHPTGANHWRTQELLFTNPLPKLEVISACRDELVALGSKAINPEMMLASRNIVAQSVVQKPNAYHWCFYYSAWRLENDLNDMRLDRSQTDKYNFYLTKMKELWILARALDASLGSKKYFGYIRSLFLDMSARHFGRRLQQITPPLGDKGQAAMQLFTKPATPLFSDY